MAPVVTQQMIGLVFMICLSAGNIAMADRKVHYIHWNKANPMFRLDNTDHIMDINSGNLPGEYDQVNIICPVSKHSADLPERHVIYSVSREEFDSCRITNPKPVIVAVCSKPHQLLYFTITFRSFSPTPGGLEFHPGQDYYFISTSSPEDLHRRVGGGCSTHNMKMIFKVSDNRDDQTLLNAPRSNEVTITKSTTEETPTSFVYSTKFTSLRRNQGGDTIYYYHPRDLITHKKGGHSRHHENEIWKNEALRYTSSSRRVKATHFLIFISSILLSRCSSFF